MLRFGTPGSAQDRDGIPIGRHWAERFFPEGISGGKEDEVKGAPGTAAGLKVDRGQLCGLIG